MRQEFGKNHQIRDVEKWMKILLSEELQFNLDDPDGFQRYGHDEDIPSETFSTIHSGEGSFMV